MVQKWHLTPTFRCLGSLTAVRLDTASISDGKWRNRQYHYNVYLDWHGFEETDISWRWKISWEVMKDLIAHKFDNANGKWGNLDVLRRFSEDFEPIMPLIGLFTGIFLGATDAMTNSEKQDAWLCTMVLRNLGRVYYPGSTISRQDNLSGYWFHCAAPDLPELVYLILIPMPYMAKLLRLHGSLPQNRTIHCVADGSEIMILSLRQIGNSNNNPRFQCRIAGTF